MNEELAKKALLAKEKPKIKHEIINEKNKPIVLKKPWWHRILANQKPLKLLV